MKVPTKQELYDQIAELEQINRKMCEERIREKEERWKKLLPNAYAKCREQLNAVFPNLVTVLHFEHVDDGGYWFTFHLVNDFRTQTFAVRHTDL